MASIAASALSNICTSQSGTAARIFWGQSGCVFGGTMTILKPMRVLLSRSRPFFSSLLGSYTTALLCPPGLVQCGPGTVIYRTLAALDLEADAVPECLRH